MKPTSFFYLHRSDRRILLTFLLVAVLLLCLLFVTGESDEGGAVAEAAPSQTAAPHAADERKDGAFPQNTSPSSSTSSQTEVYRAERFPFDPNTADSIQLRRLGLQPWQVRNIYKYRAAGGIYRTKTDFARTYGLTQKEYRELEPYIQISSDYQPAALLVQEKKNEKRDSRDTLLFPKKLTPGQTIDLAVADTSLLKRVPGIGSHYARKIVFYREQLGGYASVEQLDEIDGFPLQAKRYLRIDSAAGVRRMNLNRLGVNELRRHPYLNYYQARAIVDYRRTHGRLKSLSDLRLLRDFPPEVMRKLEPYVEF